MFLVKHGFTIISQNETYKGGEIDLIAKKDRRLYFFEVKASIMNVSRGTHYNPFDNISVSKLRKITHTVEILLQNNHVSRETKWQIDGLGVYLDKANKKARVMRIENINIQ